jgi:hypothetical protein
MVSNFKKYMSIRWLVAASLCWSAIAAGQPSVASKPYEVEDAYQICVFRTKPIRVPG